MEQSHALSLQATLEAAQEALTEHAEEMRKVTAERDALRRHLLSQSQLSASNSAGFVEDHGMIAASYETERKFSRPLSSKCKHRVTSCLTCYVSLRCCNLSRPQARFPSSCSHMILAIASQSLFLTSAAYAMMVSCSICVIASMPC